MPPELVIPPDHSARNRFYAIGIAVLLLVIIIGGGTYAYFYTHTPAQEALSHEKKIPISEVSKTVGIRALPGNIVGIQNGSFGLQVTENIQASSTLATRTVFFSASTTVMVQGAKKDTDTYQKETQDYMAQVDKMDKGDAQAKAYVLSTPYPDQYTYVPGTTKDLKIGDHVVVLTKVDVAYAENLYADSIRIVPQPATSTISSTMGTRIPGKNQAAAVAYAASSNGYHLTPLYWDGNWTGNNFWCDAGSSMQVQSFTYGNTNDVQTYQCYAPDIPPNTNPVGFLDGASCSSNIINGWAYDADTGTSVTVNVYVDGGYAGSATANQYRGDLGAYGYYRAWSVGIPGGYQTAGSHTVAVYAVDPDTSGAGSWLPSSYGSYSYTCASQPDLVGGTAFPTATAYAGSAVTFAAPVSNITGGTANNFPNLLEVRTSGGGFVADLNAGNMTLGGYGGGTVYPSYTFGSPGSYAVRVCANTYTSYANGIAESNYGNNCGAWDYFTVNSMCVAWAGSTCYAYNSCSMYNTGTYACDGSCSATPPSNSLCAVPDLTASANAYGSTVTPSSPITLTGSVMNGGTGATSGGFWNVLQVCNNTICSSYNSVTQVWANTLSNGGSTGVSNNITSPSSAGSYVYRWCANNNTSWVNTVAESNYGNNCSSWQPLTVALSCIPQSFTATPGTINYGDTTKLSWTLNTGCSTTCTVSNGDVVTGNQDTVTPPAPSSGNTDAYSVTCGVGNTANTTVTVNMPSASISVSPNLVASGGNVNLTWNSTSAHSCTVTRNGVDMGATFDLTSGSNVQDPTPITGQTTYQITCNGATSKAIVNVAGQYKQF